MISDLLQDCQVFLIWQILSVYQLQQKISSKNIIRTKIVQPLILQVFLEVETGHPFCNIE